MTEPLSNSDEAPVVHASAGEERPPKRTTRGRKPVEENGSGWTEKVDKKSWVPAYAQLARLLRQWIADETYAPGSQLPSEASLARGFGVSPMTARQAVGILADEGLVQRIQGSGTFVRRIHVLRANFTLDALHSVLADQANLDVKLLRATVENKPSRAREVLGVETGAPLVIVERLIRHRGAPFALQVAYTRFDPESPIMEKMLNTAILTEFFFEESLPSFKKGVLELLPVALDERDGTLLGEEPGHSAFRLEQLLYDYGDRPSAFGWFLMSPSKVRLMSRVGVWDD